MADDNRNDEYEFNDLDMLGSDDTSEFSTTNKTSPPPQPTPVPRRPDVRRNALIAIGVFLLLMLLYKFFGLIFSDKPTNTTATLPTVTQPVQTVTPVQSITPAVPTPAPVDNTLSQRTSALEVSQQSMRTQLDSLSSQISGLTTSISSLTSQISDLNQTVSTLSSTVESQGRQIDALTAKKHVVVRRPVVRRHVVQTIYYIQAVIPGRAWLIASNGTTLTVREGSSIPGYGVVKLIDPSQGVIITSSGRTIRFSQQDS